MSGGESDNVRFNDNSHYSCPSAPNLQRIHDGFPVVVECLPNIPSSSLKLALNVICEEPYSSKVEQGIYRSELSADTKLTHHKAMINNTLEGYEKSTPCHC
jgi:hypothetical protein